MTLERAVAAKDWSEAEKMYATVDADLNPLLSSSIADSPDVLDMRSRYEKASTTFLNRPVEAWSGNRRVPTASTPATAASSSQDEAAREIVASLQKFELIKRIDVATGKYYIDGELWQGFELDKKEQFVRAMSAYRKIEYKGLPQVTLYDSRSGKELASYGAFTGVTIR